MKENKCLLIAPSGYNFTLVDARTLNTLSTDNKSITDILIFLKEIDTDLLIIPIDQTIKDCENANFSGLELIMHIRLTPELGDTSKLPIICLHWHCVDYYINMDKENIFLYSPGIYRYQYPFENIAIKGLIPLSESLNPFLFGSEKDEYISDHVFRNEIAIKQFEQQVNNPIVELIEKEIWFKKIFYKNFGNRVWRKQETVKPILASIRILFADDMAEKWAPALKKMLPSAYIETVANSHDVNIILSQIKSNNELALNSFNVEIREYQDVLSQYKNIAEETFNLKDKLGKANIISKSAKEKIINIESEKAQKEIEFKNLIKRLTNSGGLLDALIGDINSYGLTDQNRKDANELSEAIRLAILQRNDLMSLQGQLDRIIEETLIVETALQNIYGIKDTLQKKRKHAFLKIEDTLNQLFNPKYDLLLVDLYFSESAVSKEINKTAGFDILRQLSEYKVRIPVVIFSASIQPIEQELSSLNIKCFRFIKGVTPVQDLNEFIINCYCNIEVTEQIEIIEQIRNFSNYFTRKYINNDSPEYEDLFMTPQKEQDTKQKLQSISNKLQEYNTKKTTSEKNQLLIEISQNLGTIQENRLIEPTRNNGVSFYHVSNLIKNKVGDDEVFLRHVRNKASHSQTEEWKNKVNFDLIKKLIATTYKKLILG